MKVERLGQRGAKSKGGVVWVRQTVHVMRGDSIRDVVKHERQIAICIESMKYQLA